MQLISHYWIEVQSYRCINLSLVWYTMRAFNLTCVLHLFGTKRAVQRQINCMPWASSQKIVLLLTRIVWAHSILLTVPSLADSIKLHRRYFMRRVWISTASISIHSLAPPTSSQWNALFHTKTVLADFILDCFVKGKCSTVLCIMCLSPILNFYMFLN